VGIATCWPYLPLFIYQPETSKVAQQGHVPIRDTFKKGNSTIKSNQQPFKPIHQWIIVDLFNRTCFK
jgi:hypothetical protein